MAKKISRCIRIKYKMKYEISAASGYKTSTWGEEEPFRTDYSICLHNGVAFFSCGFSDTG